MSEEKENVEVDGSGNPEQKTGRNKKRRKWKCPNPDCGKWVSGDECSNCQTGFQVKKDLDAMLRKRERDKADESRQWSRDYHRDDRGGSRRGGDRRGGGRDRDGGVYEGRGGRDRDGEGYGGRGGRDRDGGGYGGRGEGGGRRYGGRGGGGRNDDRRQNRGKWSDRRTDRRQDRYTHEKDAMDNKDMPEEDKIKIKFGQIFGDLADQLDARHDKMERIVKLSRDITVESKRIIFHLHRIQHEGEADMILADVETRLYDIRFNLWRMVALELKDEDHFQYLRKYTDGLQEWIEALSFYHYISSNRLISWQEVQDQLIFHPRSPELSDNEDTSEYSIDQKDAKKADIESSTKSDKESSAKSDKAVSDIVTSDRDMSKEIDKNNEASSNNEISSKAEAEMLECALRYYGKTSKVPDEAQIKIDELSKNGEEMRVIVPQTDFVLGLADLTGELMRNAINSLSSGDRTACFTLLTFLQTMHGGFLTVEKGAPRMVSKKMTVLKQSMRKVEDACYAIAVRGSEIPDKFVADLFEKNDEYNEDH